MTIWGTGYFFRQGDRQLFALQKSSQSPKKLPVPVFGQCAAKVMRKKLYAVCLLALVAGVSLWLAFQDGLTNHLNVAASAAVPRPAQGQKKVILKSLGMT